MSSVEVGYNCPAQRNLLERSAMEGDSPVRVVWEGVFRFQRVELFGIAALSGW